MKLGKIFICIKWPRIIYQNTSYRFDELLYYGYELCHWRKIRRRNLKIVIRKRKWFSRF